MPIPTKNELRLAKEERDKRLDKRAKLSAEASIEMISQQLLNGKDKIRATVTNPRTVKYILDAFRRKGYDVEALLDEEERKGTTVFQFSFDEKE